MKIVVAGGTGVVGREVVLAARGDGHEVVSISRSEGSDLTELRDYSTIFAGVQVIIDVANTTTLSARRAREYFERASNSLQRAGSAGGVRHLVTLSIVGLERASSYGYCAAKLRQEQLTKSGLLPWTIVRATQFHEFASQMTERAHFGPGAFVPSILIQSVAAKSVAEFLLATAKREPLGNVVGVAGPERGDLAVQARLLAQRDGGRHVVAIRAPGTSGRAMRGGALLAQDGEQILGAPFMEWLASGRPLSSS